MPTDTAYRYSYPVWLSYGSDPAGQPRITAPPGGAVPAFTWEIPGEIAIRGDGARYGYRSVRFVGDNPNGRTYYAGALTCLDPAREILPDHLRSLGGPDDRVLSRDQDGYHVEARTAAEAAGKLIVTDGRTVADFVEPERLRRLQSIGNIGPGLVDPIYEDLARELNAPSAGDQNDQR